MACSSDRQLICDKYSRCKTLPIGKYKTNIIEAIRQHQVVIIYGECGTGKTTQIPQYILKSNIDKCAHICVTQPWKFGAVFAATKVAKEMGCSLGGDVGYEVMGDNKYGTLTKIKYVTDDLLLSQFTADNILNGYDVIMIDDAHLRTISTDLLLGLLKKIYIERKNLKVVVTSVVTMNEQLSFYFDSATTILIKIRPRKVAINYEPIRGNDYVTRSLNIIKRIHSGSDPGDVLVFLAGRDEVDKYCSVLDKIGTVTVVTLHGSVNMDHKRDFSVASQNGQRRVILVSDVAESAVYVDSVKFVIDCGRMKEVHFDVKEGIKVLKRMDISKERADRRKYSGGRACKVVCYRLYKKEEFAAFVDVSIPNIKYGDFSDVYLKILGLGFDPANFEFIDPPDDVMLEYCRNKLAGLGLLDDANKLTNFGSVVAHFPIKPVSGTVLLWAHHLNCMDDVIIIMCMLHSDNVFKNCKEMSASIKFAHRKFYDKDGDHFTNLNVFREFLRNEKSREWCAANFLNYDVLIQVDQMRDQLTKVVNVAKKLRESASQNRDNIKCAIMSGYLGNKCVRTSPGTYIRAVDKEVVYLHPISSLFKESYDLIIYHELIKTTKPYILGILKIDEALLNSFASKMMDLENRIENVIKHFPISKEKRKEKKCNAVKSKTGKNNLNIFRKAINRRVINNDYDDNRPGMENDYEEENGGDNGSWMENELFDLYEGYNDFGIENDLIEEYDGDNGFGIENDLIDEYDGDNDFGIENGYDDYDDDYDDDY